MGSFGDRSFVRDWLTVKFGVLAGDPAGFVFRKLDLIPTGVGRIEELVSFSGVNVSYHFGGLVWLLTDAEPVVFRSVFGSGGSGFEDFDIGAGGGG